MRSITLVNKCSTNAKSSEVLSRICVEAMGMNSISQSESRCEVCPLNRVQAGVAVRIKQLCATPEVQNRLREIGLGEDQIIRLITSRANFICQVCNARLAISEQLAQLILVEPVRERVS